MVDNSPGEKLSIVVAMIALPQLSLDVSPTKFAYIVGDVLKA